MEQRRDTRVRTPLAKNWLMTINNYGPDDEEAFRQRTELFKCAIFGREVGENGTPHLQAFVSFHTKKRGTAISAIWPRSHQQVANGTPWENFLYCAKGSQPKAEWDTMKQHGPNYGKDAYVERFGDAPKPPNESPYKEVFAMLEAGTSVHDAMKYVAKELPRDYALHGTNIKANLMLYKVPPFVHKYKWDQFIRPLEVLDKHILIYGGTSLGKTAYALAHFQNPLYVKQIDTLRRLTPDHDGIVFDDMCFKHMDPEALISLLDWDYPREVHCRYSNATIPARLPCIFTHNTADPFTTRETPHDQYLAIERRYRRVFITEKLFVDQ